MISITMAILRTFVTWSDNTPRAEHRNTADQKKGCATNNPDCSDRNLLSQPPLQQNSRHTGYHHSYPATGGGKYPHVGSRGGGGEYELALVAKLQDEESQKRCPERSESSVLKQLGRPTPGDHADSGKNQGQGIEELQGIFAYPLVDQGTGDHRNHVVAKSR